MATMVSLSHRDIRILEVCLTNTLAFVAESRVAQSHGRVVAACANVDRPLKVILCTFVDQRDPTSNPPRRLATTTLRLPLPAREQPQCQPRYPPYLPGICWSREATDAGREDCPEVRRWAGSRQGCQVRRL